MILGGVVLPLLKGDVLFGVFLLNRRHLWPRRLLQFHLVHEVCPFLDLVALQTLSHALVTPGFDYVTIAMWSMWGCPLKDSETSIGPEYNGARCKEIPWFAHVIPMLCKDRLAASFLLQLSLRAS